MEIIFKKVKRVNLDRDGIDFQFIYYKVDNDSEAFLFHVVLKKTLNIDKLNDIEYSKNAFPIIIKYFKKHWNENKELPKQNLEYWESRELETINQNEIDWYNYRLILQ